VHPPVTQDIQSLSDQTQIDVLGVTCDSKLNTFRPRNLETATNDPNAKRLDYIFTSETHVESANVVFTEPIPDHNFNYSDHFGVSAIVQLPDELRKPSAYLPPQLFDDVAEITAQYTLREKRHSIIRIYHFFLSLTICIAMHIAIWFAHRKVGEFLILLISTVTCCAGVLDGVIGYVWGRWERRALREFASEMELARKVYSQGGLPMEQS